jgi:hypothetical protein
MNHEFLVITMQAEKSDTDTEKNEASNDATMAPVTNEVTNLKIEDTPTSSTPNSPGSESSNFLTSFKAFSKFGDPKSDGKLITLSQSDKWMKQAKVIDGKKITTTDTGIYFKKHKYIYLKYLFVVFIVHYLVPKINVILFWYLSGNVISFMN